MRPCTLILLIAKLAQGKQTIRNFWQRPISDTQIAQQPIELCPPFSCPGPGPAPALVPPHVTGPQIEILPALPGKAGGKGTQGGRAGRCST